MDRDDYVVQMRRQFCKPDVVTPGGGLNLDYFKPKASAELVWTPECEASLLAGIAEFGVGNVADIKRAFLPSWTELQLRIKMCKLLGVHKLDAFMGAKLDKASVQRVYQEHKAVGLREGRWSGVVLTGPPPPPPPG